MDNFAKFQPHQTADDKFAITFMAYSFVFVSCRFRVNLVMRVYYPLHSDFFNQMCSWYVIGLHFA